MRWRRKLQVIVILVWAAVPLVSYLDVHLLADPSTSWLVSIPLPVGLPPETSAYMQLLSQHVSKAMFFSAGVLLTLWLQGEGGDEK